MTTTWGQIRASGRGPPDRQQLSAYESRWKKDKRRTIDGKTRRQ